MESILSEQDWEYLFPMRAAEYTYSNFLKAIGKFPAVCGTYTDGRDSDAICRKSLATMFAHFAQETGGHESWRDIPEWRQALVYLREVGWVEGQKGGYNGECNPDIWQGQTWPCGKDKDGDYLSYFGRGAKQLSHNYNYGPFSDAMYDGDVRPLLDKPERVADTWMNLASAVFFFVYPQPPKPSMLHVIDGTWVPNDHDKANGLVEGFGVTIQIINGGVECGGAEENAQSLNRIAYYKEFANYLKVPIAGDEVLGCKNMKQFDEGGAGALPIYWEEDWDGAPTPPTVRPTPVSWWVTRRRIPPLKKAIMPNASKATSMSTSSMTAARATPLRLRPRIILLRRKQTWRRLPVSRVRSALSKRGHGFPECGEFYRCERRQAYLHLDVAGRPDSRRAG